MTGTIPPRLEVASDGYRVEHRRHGIAVFGWVPVSDLVHLMKGWIEQGYTLADGLIANHLKASFVGVSRESGDAWRMELGLKTALEQGIEAAKVGGAS